MLVAALRLVREFDVPGYIQWICGVDLLTRWRVADSYLEYLALHDLMMSAFHKAEYEGENMDLREDLLEIALLALYVAQQYLPDRDGYI